MHRYHHLFAVHLILLFIVPSGRAGNSTIDSNLLCKAPEWTDVATFFFGNYIVHATTTVVFPGENRLTSMVVRIVAIFFPTIGLRRAVAAILYASVFGRNPLETAARAGALCMVIRSESGNLNPYSRE
jgi:hypothetical protein